ncbi:MULTISPECIES: glycosyltransferase family 4 protein [Haloarcula]|uniref:glycosyltransferase family 4 protein n=1 Tax=Haloarcula TaxID=2237 RepID=UPI0023E7888F|nr:glycosyltransferase family 4 protein [Halomicroarcula sp. SHR3]
MIEDADPEGFSPACMLFQGAHAHPSHQVFADSIGADYRHFETGRLPDGDRNQDVNSELERVRTARSLSDHYEIVVAEGTAPIQTAMAYRLLGNWDTNVLYLAADETFYALESLSSTLLWNALKPLTARLLDGVVAVGQDVYDWSKPYLGERPVEVVHPPIDDDKYELLSDLSPNSPDEEFLLLSAGTTKPTNNYDKLAAATEELVDRGLPVQTVVLGADHPNEPYSDLDAVSTPGFVDLSEFRSYFERASVYVQPSVGDSFPVAALEGILSATPTLVTSGVGVRELLPDSQVVAPTIEGLVDGIEAHYAMPAAERRELGAAQRSLVENLTVANQSKLFRQAVINLTA